MTDFTSELAARLARNAEIASQRSAAEEAMDRAVEDRERAEAERLSRLQLARRARHAELVEHLTTVANGLKAASPQQFIVRLGWTASGEEFLAKISTRTMTPARTLLVELDRDDDEVLVRWRSDIGEALELWRLLEVHPAVLTELVLQVADQEAWKSPAGPPAFPVASPGA